MQIKLTVRPVDMERIHRLEDRLITLTLEASHLEVTLPHNLQRQGIPVPPSIELVELTQVFVREFAHQYDSLPMATVFNRIDDLLDKSGQLLTFLKDSKLDTKAKNDAQTRVGYLMANLKTLLAY